MTSEMIYGIAILAVAVLLFVLARFGYKRQVSEILFYLVVLAEKQFGGGTGEIKFAAVTAWIYERIPIALRLLFTQQEISNLIELAVTRMKEYLAQNQKATIQVTGGN
ncbi:MAG: hypothetical protein PHQ83_12155 [Eubacteriales bacterium]|nr:hypothetical protein [Eubacteriales bacterium]